MDNRPASDEELRLVGRAVARLRVLIAAVVGGVVCGVGLCVATLWLVIKGGPNVGSTLSLLRSYYPGFSVTWGGSLVGLFYGALTGALIGLCIASLYNLLLRWRR